MSWWVTESRSVKRIHRQTCPSARAEYRWAGDSNPEDLARRLGQATLWHAGCLHCAKDVDTAIRRERRLWSGESMGEKTCFVEFVDVQCGRCGSSMAHQDCMEFDCDDICPVCGGEGQWWACLSSPEWCEANPLPGREAALHKKGSR